MISSMGLLPEFGVFAKRAAPVFSLALTTTQDKKKNERLRRYIPLHRSRTAIKYDDAIMSSSPPLPKHMAPPRDHLSMSRRSLSPQQLALLDSPKHRPKGKDYDSDGSVGSRNSRRSHRSLGSNVSMEGLGSIGSNLDTLGPFVADIQKGDNETKCEPDRIPTVEEAAIDVATFLVDDYEARIRVPASTAEILASLDSEISAERSPSPLPTQSLPLFSIDPSQSILSEEALVQLRTASVRGCKVGLGTNWHDHVVLQDSKKSTKKSPLIETSDVDCAEAAYEIAKKLVLWSENIVITDDQKSPAGPPTLDDVELDLAELDELESFDGSDSRGSMSDGESENESEGEMPSTTTDSQWISATEYFERRRAEYMLSKLSFTPAQEQPRL